MPMAASTIAARENTSDTSMKSRPAGRPVPDSWDFQKCATGTSSVRTCLLKAPGTAPGVAPAGPLGGWTVGSTLVALCAVSVSAGDRWCEKQFLPAEKGVQGSAGDS